MFTNVLNIHSRWFPLVHSILLCQTRILKVYKLEEVLANISTLVNKIKDSRFALMKAIVYVLQNQISGNGDVGYGTVPQNMT